MSFEHQDAAALLEGLPPGPKSVLVHLAQPACVVCGLAWPGVGWLEKKTGLGHTAVRAALEWLVRAGHVTIHAYPHGGRGRSTEYVVLPGLTELSTVPCGECRKRMKTGRHAAGIDRPVTEKPTATRPVLEKPTAQTPQNPPPGGLQSVIESESVTRVRATPAENSPPARLTPPSGAPPLTDAENAAEARALIRDLSLKLVTPSSRDGTLPPKDRNQ